MISESISKQITEAMKAKDEVRLSTLRMLSSELHNAKIAKQRDLTGEEELEVIRREAKKRKDAFEVYKKAGADERAEKEKEELGILQEFLPQDLSDKELEDLVSKSISQTNATGMVDMGKVIGAVMKKAGGRAEGGRVSEMVKSKLT